MTQVTIKKQPDVSLVSRCSIKQCLGVTLRYCLHLNAWLETPDHTKTQLTLAKVGQLRCFIIDQHLNDVRVYLLVIALFLHLLYCMTLDFRFRSNIKHSLHLYLSGVQIQFKRRLKSVYMYDYFGSGFIFNHLRAGSQ